jgi:NTE family protein
MMKKTCCLLAATLLGAFSCLAGAAERPRVGLVLGGGGARGAAHIGVLEVLQKHNVRIDCVAGTSMGGLVAGGFAGGLTPQYMRDELAKVDWHDLFLDNPDYSQQGYRIKKLSKRFIPGLEMGLTEKGGELPAGVVSGQKIRIFFDHLVQADVGERRIEDLPLKLSLIATDIGNGDRVVFREGSLTTAMRSSMSVPGLLSPVDYQGRKLVDGGLVDNVPIAEVRERCKPDVVIAVNVGSPLLKPEEVGSLLTISAQMVNILTEQNVSRSLATLGPKDVYIKPDLDGITATDFHRNAETADRGRAAAEAVVEKLKALSVGPEEYAAWWQTVSLAKRTAPVIDEIEIAGMHRINPATVQSYLSARPGEKIDHQALYDDIQRVYGTGDFERVEYSLLPLRDRNLLRVVPVEKPWGPDYLRYGLGIRSEKIEGSSYLLRAAYQKTAMNSLGGELLVAGELGNRPLFGIDYYQPIDPAQRFFVEATYQFNRDSQGIYQDNHRDAEYRIDRQSLTASVGTNLGVYGQARVGWREKHNSTSVETGAPSLNEGSFSDHGPMASLDIDQFDRRYFPTRGWKAGLTYFDSQKFDYRRVDATLQAAHSIGDVILIGGLLRSASLDGALPLNDPARLGGLFNLSAFGTNQILGGSSMLYSARAEKIVGRMPLGLSGDLRVGAGFERGRVSDRYTETDQRGWLNSAMFYFASETPLGPVYLGYAHSPQGSSNLYLIIGTP